MYELNRTEGSDVAEALRNIERDRPESLSRLVVRRRDGGWEVYRGSEWLCWSAGTAQEAITEARAALAQRTPR